MVFNVTVLQKFQQAGVDLFEIQCKFYNQFPNKE